jgi:hypothetical protein
MEDYSFQILVQGLDHKLRSGGLIFDAALRGGDERA